MTYLDAAYTILKAAGQPLHFEEITQRALAQKLIAPQGLTPEATMGSRLYTDTKQEGSYFVRAGKGAFGLAQWQPKGIDAHVAEINTATRKRLTQLVLAMPPERFEVLIRELLIRMGFDENTVKVTPYSGDGGIDVTGIYRAAGLTEMSAAVQVKRWKGNGGNGAGRRVLGRTHRPGRAGPYPRSPGVGCNRSEHRLARRSDADTGETHRLRPVRPTLCGGYLARGVGARL
jgi:restriction system protein